MKPLDKSLSRREFTHKAALTTAVLLGLPELSPAEGNTTPGANTVEPSSTQAPAGAPKLSPRSEEHTSELQSHSFISYAVFCLKKNEKQMQRSGDSADVADFRTTGSADST